jgi:integrase
MRLNDYFTSRYIPDRLANGSPRTAKEYRLSIARLDRHLGRPARVKDLKTKTLTRFKASEIEGHVPDTVNKHLRQLMAIARHAVKWSKLKKIPAVEKLKEAKRAAVAWTPAEMQAIIEAAHRQPGRVKTIPADKWWPALIMALYDTGARISAMMAARWEWLDGKVLTIPAEVQKQNADQRYTLRPQTLKAIQSIRPWEESIGPRKRLKEGLIFDWCYDPDRTWRILTRHYRDILSYAGLPHTPKDCFHKIRRTTATRIADASGKVAAQSYLGHSSPKVTERYIDFTQVRAANVTEYLPDI